MSYRRTKKKMKKNNFEQIEFRRKEKEVLKIFNNMIYFWSGGCLGGIFWRVERCDIAKYKNLFSHTLWIPKNIYKCEKNDIFLL